MLGFNVLKEASSQLANQKWIVAREIGASKDKSLQQLTPQFERKSRQKVFVGKTLAAFLVGDWQQSFKPGKAVAAVVCFHPKIV